MAIDHLFANYINIPAIRLATSEKQNNFIGLERTSEDLVFAIGQPLLEHLVTAEFVVSDRGGDIAPESTVVQVYVKGPVTQHRFRRLDFRQLRN